jgi:uncharacterized membrane protein
MQGMFVHYVLLFYIYGFLGWNIEFFYRAYQNKRLTNPGILYGPFLPMYGFSAAGIVAAMEILKVPLPVLIAFCTVMVTVFEYAVSFITERLFKIKLWDYSDLKYNMHGRVSLIYSFYWAILISVFLFWFHPFLSGHVFESSPEKVLLIVMFLSGILVYDIIFTMIMLFHVRNLIGEFNEQLTEIHLDTYVKERLKRVSRLMRGYPHLAKTIHDMVASSTRQKKD